MLDDKKIVPMQGGMEINMKHLPNIITMSRIVSAIALMPIQTFSLTFFVIYTYCGVSDVLDGLFARKLHCDSEIGARLDSIADIVFYAVTAIKILPALCNILVPLHWCLIAVVVILRLACYAVACVKYHCFASLHTYLNKLTGFLIFTIPYIIFQPFAKLICLIICIVAVVAAVEELVIHICAYQYCANRKTLINLHNE